MTECQKDEIILFEEQDVKLEVNIQDDTVWLTQAQMASLFDRGKTSISQHIKDIFRTELDEKSNSKKIELANSDKPVTIYNLDVVISVGYRVKSKNGIAFRHWATKVLKDYAIKGYAINESRLKYLEKTVKLLNIAGRATDQMQGDEAKEVIKVINDYYDALDLLNAYDTHQLDRPKGIKSKGEITYNGCYAIINQLKYKNTSNIFWRRASRRRPCCHSWCRLSKF